MVEGGNRTSDAAPEHDVVWCEEDLALRSLGKQTQR